MSTLYTILDNLFGALLIGTTWILSPLLRPWYAYWGASDDEINRTLPGDDIVPAPSHELTHAITIRAPAAQVWPWLVQMGQGRGGLYSYEYLENLIGCQIHNVDHIIPEFQDLRVRDSILFMPTGLGQIVTEIIPGHAIVMQNRDPKTGQNVPQNVIAGSWAFVLESEKPQSTRLIVRSRSDFPPTFSNVLIWRVITEPMQFVMERRMLLGIQERAERAAARKTTVKAHS